MVSFQGLEKRGVGFSVLWVLLVYGMMEKFWRWAVVMVAGM